jgi:competence protein ComEC
MKKRKIIYSLILLLVILGLIVFLITSFSQKKSLSVIFLDVGQGDAILISQGNKQILIDGGKDPKIILEKLGKYIPFWDREIETIVATHPDQDHIGGLIRVIENYKVDSVIETELKSDSETYKKWESDIEKEKSQKVEAKKGVKIDLGSGAVLEIVYPFSKVENNLENSNEASVVVKIIYGENSFLLTGDFPIEKDKTLIDSGADLKAEVLKVSHHGSKYATSSEFLDAVKPKTAIISVGKNNSYGHPNPELLQRLISRGISIFKTSEKGDIIFECQNINATCVLQN